MKSRAFAFGGLGLCFIGFVYAQQARELPEDHRPPLFFREEWKRMAADGEHSVVQADLVNQGLELKLYGDKPGVLEVQHALPKTDPAYIWTGLCTLNCALALRDRNNYVDLTGLAKIHWRTKETGFHLLRPIIKLPNGTWLVGDHTDGYTIDWQESEITLADLHWRTLDANKVVEAPSPGGKWADPPDLSRVDEVGFTDLAIGSGHGTGGSSRIAWIEVYGRPVPREPGSVAGSK